jgi:hypothetical protein
MQTDSLQNKTSAHKNMQNKPGNKQSLQNRLATKSCKTHNKTYTNNMQKEHTTKGLAWCLGQGANSESLGVVPSWGNASQHDKTDIAICVYICFFSCSSFI